jgi:hypothetical protein
MAQVLHTMKDQASNALSRMLRWGCNRWNEKNGVDGNHHLPVVSPKTQTGEGCQQESDATISR